MESTSYLKKVILNLQKNCSINMETKFHSLVDYYLQSEHISLPCGIGKTNFVKFSIYTFLGSLIWNTMLTYVGIIFGHNWKNIDKYAIYLDVVSACVIWVFIIWFIVKIRKRRKTNQKGEIPQRK
jgi:hypothetical protein